MRVAPTPGSARFARRWPRKTVRSRCAGLMTTPTGRLLTWTGSVGTDGIFPTAAGIIPAAVVRLYSLAAASDPGVLPSCSSDSSR
jgi:hypothetical protein